MSNWLANATGIHISPKRSYVNRNQFGNMLKNVSPIAGAFTGGLGGLLLGGAGSALGRGVQKGANLGNILGQGASGAALSGVGNMGINALKGAFAGGGSAAGAGAGAGGSAGGSAAGAMPGAVEEIQAGNVVHPAASKFGFGGPGLLKSAGNFLKDNTTAVGMGLKGLGDIQGAGSQNRLANAQASRLEYETEEERRRQRALEPLRRALEGQLTQPRYQVSASPYAGR